VTARRALAEDVLVRRAAHRLGVQAAAFVAVAVVLITGAAIAVMLDDQDRAAQNLLNATIALADDVQDPPLDTFLVIRDAGGQRATVGLPEGAADPAALDAADAGRPATTTERRVGGVDYRVMTERRADGLRVQAVLDMTARQADRRRILAAILGSGFAGLLLAAAAGTWLGRRALQPLSAALALQRRFVADAGHELRTPLTLLGTRVQLLRRRLRQVRDDRGAPVSERSERTMEAAPAPSARAGERAIGGVPGEADRAQRGSAMSWQDGAAAGRPLSGTAVARLALEDMDEILGDSARLTAILEDLLLAADPLADRPRGRLDLVQVCRDAVRAAAATADQQRVALRGPGPGPAVEVLGSEVALHRAVLALVDNALRHARGAVSVHVGREHGLAVVDVTDDGPGVDPALVPRLFDRFATGSPATDPEPRRYGLGLALVTEIAAAHRGQVELRPRGGGSGTTLRITIPVPSGADLQETSETAPRRSRG
jgi:two-component system, OmpR family, sensor kinase